jgi:hypothetical protein
MLKIIPPAAGPVTWTFVALSVLKSVGPDLKDNFGGDLSAAAAELFRTVIDVDHDGYGLFKKETVFCNNLTHAFDTGFWGERCLLLGVSL